MGILPNIRREMTNLSDPVRVEHLADRFTHDPRSPFFMNRSDALLVARTLDIEPDGDIYAYETRDMSRQLDKLIGRIDQGKLEKFEKRFGAIANRHIVNGAAAVITAPFWLPPSLYVGALFGASLAALGPIILAKTAIEELRR